MGMGEFKPCGDGALALDVKSFSARARARANTPKGLVLLDEVSKWQRSGGCKPTAIALAMRRANAKPWRVRSTLQLGRLLAELAADDRPITAVGPTGGFVEALERAGTTGSTWPRVNLCQLGLVAHIEGAIEDLRPAALAVEKYNEATRRPGLRLEFRDPPELPKPPQVGGPWSW